MHFRCNRQDLVNAIQIVSKAVASKPQIPILSGIHVEAKGDSVILQGTDHETGIIASLEADVEEAGRVVLSARYLQDVVRRMPGEEMTFAYDKERNTTRIQADGAHFSLLSMNPDDYPLVRTLTEGIRFKMQDKTLREVIRRTVFACSTDELRPIYTGCYMETQEKQLCMVATNTHRLAVMKVDLENPVEGVHVIIPAKILNELARVLLSDVPMEVEVTCSPDHVSFQWPHLFISSRLIEGQFPSYERAIPSKRTTVAHLNRQAFLAAVERMALISRTNDYNTVRLHLHENTLHISSNEPDIGEAEESIPAQSEGPEVEIAFNARYLTDALKAIRGESFCFALIDNLSPAVMTEEDDPSFIYVITPVRTGR